MSVVYFEMMRRQWEAAASLIFLFAIFRESTSYSIIIMLLLPCDDCLGILHNMPMRNMPR